MTWRHGFVLTLEADDVCHCDVVSEEGEWKEKLRCSPHGPPR